MQSESFIPVCSLPELQDKQMVVVTGVDRPIAVIAHGGQIVAVDNRCPHMGFPLHTGSIQDGILTCHWHEARFDICNGCTFDLWADDVASFSTEIRDEMVYVCTTPSHVPDAEYHLQRLRHGLEHGIGLIQAKAILGLRRLGVTWVDLVTEIARFGAGAHDDWGEGMTTLAAVANLITELSERTAFFSVLRASRQLGADCLSAVPRRRGQALTDSRHSSDRLRRWLRDWVTCRHRDGTERVLLTAVETLGDRRDLADLVADAAAHRVYARGGHVLDACNKSLELLEQIGWEDASDVLPLVLSGLVAARGAEEDAHWHHPIELIGPLREAEHLIPEWLEAETDETWDDASGLRATVLGDDPLLIIKVLGEAIRNGAPLQVLSREIAYTAGLRLAQFSTSNEVRDWFNPRHTFIFANAVHQFLKRCVSPATTRSLFHAALSVYMDRFLNIPAARLPTDEDLQDLPEAGQALREMLLEVLDRQSAVDLAGRIVTAHLARDEDTKALFDTLALATVREDFDFHALQVLEAGWQQFTEWDEGPERAHIVIGVVRQLAAFCPTPRAGFQTARIARRLDRGDRIYEEQPAT
jgi:nitrite reductase/ring-hydroxylating ferredoxin subunit